MTYNRTLDTIVTSWMPGCNSSENCKICDRRGDGSSFNVHFIFPLSLSSHSLSTLALLSLMGLTNQHVTTGQSLSLKSIFDIFLAELKATKFSIYRNFYFLFLRFHILLLICDLAFGVLTL